MVVGNHSLPTDLLDTCTDGLFYCMGKWGSDVTTGAFWVMALIAFTVVIYLATSRLGGGRAFGFASFVGMMGGIWLSVLTFIPWWIGSTFIIIGIIGLVSMIVSDD